MACQVYLLDVLQQSTRFMESSKQQIYSLYMGLWYLSCLSSFGFMYRFISPPIIIFSFSSLDKLILFIYVKESCSALYSLVGTYTLHRYRLLSVWFITLSIMPFISVLISLMSKLRLFGNKLATPLLLLLSCENNCFHPI